MRIIVGISRVIVGTLFVISGLIKANDPYGFSYKLDEYFTVFSNDLGTVKKEVPVEVDENLKNSPCYTKLDIKKEYILERIPEEELGFLKKFLIQSFGWFAKNSLLLAVLICVVEIVLGLFTVMGFRMKLVTWILFLMILFFTFLTFYSAYYNKVTDCGCFGDALKLTPWQSFGKDVFLLIFILPLFIWRKKINGYPMNSYEYVITASSMGLMIILSIVQFKWNFPIFFHAAFLGIRIGLSTIRKPVIQEMGSLILITLASAFFTQYCIDHNSVRDYRPWRVGNNTRELRIGKPELAEIEMVYLNKNTCEEVRQSTKDWSWLDSTFEANHIFYKQDKQVIEPAIEPKIKDMSLEDPETGESMADSLFNFPGYAFLLVSPDLKKASEKNMDRINAIAEYSLQNGILFIGGTSSDAETIDEFRHKHQNMFRFYFNDEKALKTILRSNPGLVLLKDGIVVGKWHYNDIPTLDKMRSEYLK